jgi:hypothetical protein
MSIFSSIGGKINKLRGTDDEETQEGVASDLLPELELSLSDEDLISLTEKWEKAWNNSDVKSEWEKKCDENENYWLGKQFGKAELEQLRPLVDNLIFESLETFLPQATRRNPEPTVELDSREAPSPENLQFAQTLEKRLADIADELKLRLKVKKAARHWSLYLLGAAKMGWDINRDGVAVRVTRAKKLILDPNGTVDEDGYTGEFIGEVREMKASILIQLASKKSAFITEKVSGDLGTKIKFKEWWTDEYMCWTLDKEVLLKRKNPHWNYDQKQTSTSVDDMGVETPNEQTVPGQNHFPVPKIPYVFLSIFNLGKQPVDDTSLISQNLSSQDLINKRLKQIDKNADSMNGGMVVSGERSGLDKEQAGQVTEALRKGGTVYIPTGAPSEAVERMAANPLPSDVFNQLADTRSRLIQTFGVQGLTSQGIGNEKTVRGKIITKGLDTDRIGGGVTEYLEQFADDIFNWIVQMLYVYDEQLNAIPKPKVVISVKEGSLLPKDNVTQANQAVELWSAGALDPITLFEKLEYSNPKETAKNLYLWLNAPQMLFEDDPQVQGLMQQQQAQAQAQMDQQASQEQQTQQQDLQKAGMDHEAKLQQIQAQQQGDLLKQVPTQ